MSKPFVKFVKPQDGPMSYGAPPIEHLSEAEEKKIEGMMEEVKIKVAKLRPIVENEMKKFPEEKLEDIPDKILSKQLTDFSIDEGKIDLEGVISERKIKYKGKTYSLNNEQIIKSVQALERHYIREYTKMDAVDDMQISMKQAEQYMNDPNRTQEDFIRVMEKIVMTEGLIKAFGNMKYWH
jgi:YHS domain-containing protein